MAILPASDITTYDNYTCAFISTCTWLQQLFNCAHSVSTFLIIALWFLLGDLGLPVITWWASPRWNMRLLPVPSSRSIDQLSGGNIVQDLTYCIAYCMHKFVWVKIHWHLYFGTTCDSGPGHFDRPDGPCNTIESIPAALLRATSQTRFHLSLHVCLVLLLFLAHRGNRALHAATCIVGGMSHTSGLYRLCDWGYSHIPIYINIYIYI